MKNENARTTDDAVRANRTSRSQLYFEDDLRGQRDWYSGKASGFKTKSQQLSLTIIAAGALTAIVSVFGPSLWVTALMACLGGLVAIAEGWKRIARYDETWMAYRVASERMKREQRLYVNGAGAYRTLDDEEEAYLHFVEVIEMIIAEEQQIFWSSRNEGGDQSGVKAMVSADDMKQA